MQRCPCCNARLGGRLVCARCRADLTMLDSVAKASREWLKKAIHYYLQENLELCITALDVSLRLKKTSMATVFREIVIRHICQDIVHLLSSRQLIAAKRLLFQGRHLLPYSLTLQRLHLFSDYLLVCS